MTRCRNARARSTKNKQYKKQHDVKNRGRDIDQIQDDIIRIKRQGKTNMEFEADEDIPGLGQHYCIVCARHFSDDATFQNHTTTKAHKRRLKDVEKEKYTQEEAELAAGKSKEVLPSIRAQPQSMITA